MKTILMYIAIWFCILLWGYNLIMNMAIASTICPHKLLSICDISMFMFPFYHMIFGGAILIMFSQSKFCNLSDYKESLSLSMFTIVLYIITLIYYVY